MSNLLKFNKNDNKYHIQKLKRLIKVKFSYLSPIIRLEKLLNLLEVKNFNNDNVFLAINTIKILSKSLLRLFWHQNLVNFI